MLKKTYRLKWNPRIAHIPTVLQNSFNGSEVLSILHDAIGVTFKYCQINIVDAASLLSIGHLAIDFLHVCRSNVSCGAPWKPSSITDPIVWIYSLQRQWWLENYFCFSHWLYSWSTSTFVMTDTKITSFSLSLTAIFIATICFSVCVYLHLCEWLNAIPTPNGLHMKAPARTMSKC